MVVVYVLIVSVGLLVWAAIADRRSSKRDYDECKAKAEEWLKEQNALPKHYVYVLTKTNKVFLTLPFEPTAKVEYGFSSHFVRMGTSLQWALNRVESTVKSGRFHDQDTNTFIPMCEIEYLQIKQAE